MRKKHENRESHSTQTGLKIEQFVYPHEHIHPHVELRKYQSYPQRDGLITNKNLRPFS